MFKKMLNHGRALEIILLIYFSCNYIQEESEVKERQEDYLCSWAKLLESHCQVQLLALLLAMWTKL